MFTNEFKFLKMTKISQVHVSTLYKIPNKLKFNLVLLTFVECNCLLVERPLKRLYIYIYFEWMIRHHD